MKGVSEARPSHSEGNTSRRNTNLAALFRLPHHPPIEFLAPFNRALWWIAAFGAAGVVIVISPAGKDSFRLPKELFFQFVSILLITTGLLAITARRYQAGSRSFFGHPVVIQCCAILGWTLASTLMSTKRMLSVHSLLWVTLGVSFFLFVFCVARDHSLHSVLWIVVPITMASAYAILQRLLRFNIMTLRQDLPSSVIGSSLVGNPSDVGSLMVAPILAVISVIFATRRFRLLYVASLVLMMVGLLMSETYTAIAALICGILVLFWQRRGMARLAGVVAVFLVSTLLFVFVGLEPLREGAHTKVFFAQRGKLDELLSGRLAPARAAAQMFSEHPVTGTGPGSFSWQYPEYKSRLISDGSIRHAADISFGEVHNDHLEILAETGMPGYIVFLIALSMIGYNSWRLPLRADDTKDPTGRGKFAAVFGLPLMVSTFVLCMGQFPLQIAVTTTTLLFFAAVTLAWCNDLAE